MPFLSALRSSDFNPRSSCEERQQVKALCDRYDLFQSTLLMRGATRKVWLMRRYFIFQSTLLMRGATQRRERQSLADRISIHAPHARSDALFRCPNRTQSHHFNPRSSCEERLLASGGDTSIVLFQSTLLMRGATCSPWMSCTSAPDFNPRSSCEERHNTKSYISAL